LQLTIGCSNKYQLFIESNAGGAAVVELSLLVELLVDLDQSLLFTESMLVDMDAFQIHEDLQGFRFQIILGTNSVSSFVPIYQLYQICWFLLEIAQQVINVLVLFHLLCYILGILDSILHFIVEILQNICFLKEGLFGSELISMMTVKVAKDRA